MSFDHSTNGAIRRIFTLGTVSHLFTSIAQLLIRRNLVKILLKEVRRKFLKYFGWILSNTWENVKWVIFLQEFKEILNKLKQLLKKFYANLVQVKCGQILIKTYTAFE